MDSILPQVDRALILKELTKERFVRKTNNLDNEIYIFNGNEAPNLLNEVGILREISFRDSGGGTGKPLDLDEFDTGTYPYLQLIVWDPHDQEIIGGYRFIKCINAKDQNGTFHLSTSEIFQFTDRLKTSFFPFTIELGRSWVQPRYQPKPENRKGLFSLDNLWDGLGAITVLYPEIKYFFGKVTMYPHFNQHAKDLILSFMHHYFPDNDGLIHIEHPLKIVNDCSEFLSQLNGLSYKDGHHLLNKWVRQYGENIPPLFNSYMNLSPTMKTFGTAINHHFGGVEETGIMVTIADIYPSKKDRHIQSFLDFLSGKSSTKD